MPRGVYTRSPEHIAALIAGHKRAAATRQLEMTTGQLHAAIAARAKPPPVYRFGQSLVDALSEVFVQVLLATLKDPRVLEALRPPASPQAPTQPLEAPLIAALRNQLAPLERAPARPPLPRKQHVLIGGMKGHQVQELTASVNGLPVRLTFWRTDDSLHQLKDAAIGCDVAIDMVDFLSHQADAIMKANARCYIRQNGGVGSMINAVRQFVKEG